MKNTLAVKKLSRPHVKRFFNWNITFEKEENQQRPDRLIRPFIVEIVAPLLTPNLQPHSNQVFPKSLIYNQICKTPFANHCTTLQKCGYNVGTFADILYICIDEKFEHYGSFICT